MASRHDDLEVFFPFQSNFLQSVKTFYVIREETGYELEVKGCLVGHFAEILKLQVIFSVTLKVQTDKYNRHCTQTMYTNSV